MTQITLCLLISKNAVITSLDDEPFGRNEPSCVFLRSLALDSLQLT